jgi:hypothetical protein
MDGRSFQMSIDRLVDSYQMSATFQIIDALFKAVVSHRWLFIEFSGYNEWFNSLRRTVLIRIEIDLDCFCGMIYAWPCDGSLTIHSMGITVCLAGILFNEEPPDRRIYKFAIMLEFIRGKPIHPQ